MRYIEVLINLPVNSGDATFTYHVPPVLEAQIEFGRRVLVALGPRKVEGYIVNDKGLPWSKPTLPVLKVLDESPVLDQNSFALAQWMADYYCCPLSIALGAMIPRRLSKKTGKSVVSLVSMEELDHMYELNANAEHLEFLAELQERGEISYQQALKVLNGEGLELLQSLGLIYISGSYSGYRLSKNKGNYLISDFNPARDMAALSSKAPRQAEAMQILLERGSVDSEELEKKIPVASLRSLLQKGYIAMESHLKPISPASYTLTPGQARVMAELERAIIAEDYREYLLYGITGSGKTEIYIRAALSVLSRGKSAMVLIPEIALTRHLVEVFAARIPDFAVLHSRMSPGERYEDWKRIRAGQVRLVLGTRSAVFAPLPNLGLIIIDEEQEHSYKQQEQPRYHAREVARKRAEMDSALLLLGSATPSLESYHRARLKKTGLLSMPQRVGTAVLPQVFIADMRKAKGGERGIISPLLREKVSGILERGEQAILFQNRRGFAPVTLCLDCGHIPGCPRCSVALTYHRDGEREICHYCNYQTRVLINCPLCGSNKLQQVGTGTQKVESEVREMFPQARIARMDLDSSQKKDSQPRILEGMKNGDIDILIGTQMVARGLDFPGVSLVGILDVDNMLNLPDFRAGERCFQLIVQAAGRAGRGSIPGEVVIQAYNPEHNVVRMAARQDYEGFFREEIKLRRVLSYPPFTHLLRIVLVSEQEKLARELADMISLEIIELGDAKEEEFVILGPAPCPLYRIKNRFRYQLIIKCDNILLLSSIGKTLMTRATRKGVRLQMEIDPLTSM